MNSTITYDKPFKTYDEQLNILESRNIIISDRAFAKRALSSLSYYTLINGYKNTFLSVPGSDDFVKGTTFEAIYTLHIIDTSLNSIILKHILFVERYLKTRLSYLISEKYGVYTDPKDNSNKNPDDYLYRGNYKNRGSGRGVNNILKKIKACLTSPQINDSVAHYANDKNHIPAWILVSTIPFGLTIKWYSILKSDDKQRICEEFISDTTLTVDEKKEFFTKALFLLKEYRNKIAHGNRTFNVTNLPVLPKKSLLALSKGSVSEAAYNAGYGKNDSFAVILICFMLLNDSYLHRNFLRDLEYTLMPYKGIDINGQTIFEAFRLPNDFFDKLRGLI